MRIVLIVAGAVTGALLLMVLLTGVAVARAGECMKTRKMINRRRISNKQAGI